VGMCVRVPEPIGSRRLAPAIQKMFAFQAKLVGMGVGVEALCELLSLEVMSAPP
jgi:hypothetical protein